MTDAPDPRHRIGLPRDRGMNQFVPYSIESIGGHPLVRWIEPSADSQALPFFSRWLQREIDARRPQRLTTLDALLPFDGPDPAALVLHESRCGSTLLSQSLAECGAVTAVSEALPVNQLLVLPGLRDDDRATLLRGLIRAILDGLGDGARPGLVKFTSWNVLLLPVIRAAFPKTPWVFVYRDPLEVLASHARRPAQWLSRPTFLETFVVAHGSSTQLDALDETRRCAALIGAFGHAALRAQPSASNLLNYRELPAALANDLPTRFNLSLSDSQRGSTIALTTIYSKDPTRRVRFDAEAERRDRAVTPAMRAADREYSRETYDALEAAYMLRSVAPADAR